MRSSWRRSLLLALFVLLWGKVSYANSAQAAALMLPTGVTAQPTIQPLAAIERIASGEDHSCAITEPGGVKCWGKNDFGQLGDGTTIHRPTPVWVIGLPAAVTTVAAGRYHTCALTISGTVYCWGANYVSQLGDGSSIDRRAPALVSGLNNNVIALSAGHEHTCALTSLQTLYCWGANRNGQLGDGSTTDRATATAVNGLAGGVTNLDLGDTHSCALLLGGAVQCWGDNAGGQVGDGTNNERHLPVTVSGFAAGAVAVAAGGGHSCVLTSAGGVQCWGSNGLGQLGDGTWSSHWTPADVPGQTSNIQQVIAGSAYSCAVTTAGAVACWGADPGSRFIRATPSPVAGLTSPVRHVAAGAHHSCALLESGQVMCWGWNVYGQVGNDTSAAVRFPMPVVGLQANVAAIAAGGFQSCVRLTDGGVQCWGSGGTLGDGSYLDRATPGDVAGLGAGAGVQRITSGGNHNCAITATGGATCWGSNYYGQIGDDSPLNSFVAMPSNVVGLPTGVAAISGGTFHTCALTTPGGALCWGRNNLGGMLGDGTLTNRPTPVAVTGLTSNVSQISAGGYQSCAIREHGELRCWGRNGFGEVGDGTTTMRLTPVTISSLPTSVTAVATGKIHTCALTAANEVWCWGANYAGQVGNGTTSEQWLPVRVTGFNGPVAALVAGAAHSCALLSAGAVQCWGDNQRGAVGNNAIENEPIPVTVTGIPAPVVALSAHEHNTCALTNSGAAWCWGDNVYGQVGNGTLAYVTTAVTVVDGNSPPTQLQVSTHSTTQINLTWFDNAASEDHFAIERCMGNTCSIFQLVATTNQNTTLYADGALTSATTYCYRVRAVAADGQQSVPSNRACIATANPTTIAVTLPTNATGTPSSQVTIPVQLPATVDGEEIVAYDFRLTFDPAVLTFASASTAGTLSNGWNITPNTATPGAVQIVAFNAAPLVGSGTLLNLVFNVVGAANSATGLTWTNFVFNEGEPAAQTSNGLFTVRAAWNVGGTVTYRTTTRPMSGLTLDLSGASTANTTTNSNGGYSFTVQASGAHTVTPSKSGGVNGISAFDAAYIAQCVAAVRNLADCPLLAADTSGNNALSAFDAAQVAQYVAGLAGPTSRVGRWLFAPASRTYATLTGDLTTENYGAYLVGEVSGNWQPPAATAAQQTTSEQTAAPLTVATAADGTVTLGHTGAVSDLLAYQITLHYDPNLGRLTEVIPAAAVGADQGWELVVNEATPGVVELVGYGVTPVNGTGELITLRFQDGAGQTVLPTVSAVKVQLNEESFWLAGDTPLSPLPYQQLLPFISN